MTIKEVDPDRGGKPSRRFSLLVSRARLRAAFDAEQHARHQEVRRLGQNVKPSRRRLGPLRARSISRVAFSPPASSTNCQVPGQVVASSVTWWQRTSARFGLDSDYART